MISIQPAFSLVDTAPPHWVGGAARISPLRARAYRPFNQLPRGVRT
jgi:hypothetical protein